MHRQYSMANKLPAFVLSACLVFGLLSGVMISTHATGVSKKTLQEKGELTIAQLVELVRAPLFNSDTISIQVALQKVTEDQSIISASVEDVAGQLVAQSRKAVAEKVEAKTFSRDIVFQDTLAGKVRLTINSQAITQRYNQLVTNWLGAFQRCLYLPGPQICRAAVATTSADGEAPAGQLGKDCR